MNNLQKSTKKGMRLKVKTTVRAGDACSDKCGYDFLCNLGCAAAR